MEGGEERTATMLRGERKTGENTVPPGTGVGMCWTGPPSAVRTRNPVPTDHARSPREDQVGCIASPVWGKVRVP